MGRNAEEVGDGGIVVTEVGGGDYEVIGIGGMS